MNLDFDNPDANMYGCVPCPKCRSRSRWPDQQFRIHCDECGRIEEPEEEPDERS